jgi:hypothetical protein
MGIQAIVHLLPAGSMNWSPSATVKALFREPESRSNPPPAENDRLAP